MRAYFIPLGLCFCLALTGPVQAHDDFPELSLSLDLVGQGAFAQGGPSFSGGIGGSLFGDWRPVNWISLGLGLGFTEFPGNGSWQAGAFDIGGRLFPFSPSRDGEWYLQGGLGLSLASKTLQGKWPGNANGNAGFGYRKFLGEETALDLGAQYDFYTPRTDPLSAVGVKVGLTWLFNTLPKTEKTAPAPEKPIPTPVAQKKTKARPKPKKKSAPAPVTYTWVAGDNLDAIAEAFFGRGNLYPLIVDANKLVLGGPAGLQPGVKLVIPRDVSEADKDKARANATLSQYTPWEKVGLK